VYNIARVQGKTRTYRFCLPGIN